ncbi:luciferase domain-containing protein [Rhodococcus opacus]|uniref:luciferase domain-containing protein n=1 Tax=Rhodococcus opacus TaxID=37919 RepID=UPI00155AA996|nr:luciferase family protein [Rhodococcus opacus]
MTAKQFPAPVVAEWGSTDPSAPLVVLLHGRGSDEAAMGTLVPFLPPGPRYVAVRAPLSEGGGFAWFANRGIGRPIQESLTATMSWFRSWLDSVTTPKQPVILVGFSGGSAFAGGLLLADPSRFSGAGLLYGTLPFDVGLPLTAGRLTGVPIFLVHGLHDTVIPPELQEWTWEYLVKYSGSPLWAEREPTGHELTERTIRALGWWVSERLNFITRPTDEDGGTSGTSDTAAYWPTLPDGTLPHRVGPAPEVSVTTPQQQETQNAPPELQEALFERIRQLPGVTIAPSEISVPGARALQLGPEDARGGQEAFIVPSVGEFAHLHPHFDGSMHIVLPPALAVDALQKGWAVAHPLAGLRLSEGMVLVYGPRDTVELDVVTGIVGASHAFATKTGHGVQNELRPL